MAIRDSSNPVTAGEPITATDWNDTINTIHGKYISSATGTSITTPAAANRAIIIYSNPYQAQFTLERYGFNSFSNLVLAYYGATFSGNWTGNTITLSASMTVYFYT